jgi:molybdate transport system substrate-binding protein
MPLRPFLLSLLALLLGTVELRAEQPVTVFAAASLKTVLGEVAVAWTGETQKTARLSYAASSALARQIEQGAPADVFISADLDWMDYLAKAGLIDAKSRVNLLGNDLVLVAPATPEQGGLQTIAEALRGLSAEGRLAMADVRAVPAGKYGKAALESLGLWPEVERRIAQAENVRAALKLVATGEAPLGIVYRTDAEAEAGVRIVAQFPGTSHPPIIYPAARVAASANGDANAFIAFLRTAHAAKIFSAHGFKILDGAQ